MNEDSRRLPAGSEIPAPELVSCWRCGKDVAASVPNCPYCAATLCHQAASNRCLVATSSPSSTLTRVFVVFGILLLMSLVFGLFPRAWVASQEVPRQPKPSEVLGFIIALELIDSIVVVAALMTIPVQRKNFQQPDFGVRATTWLAAFPALAVMLATNFLYHQVLIELVDLESLEALLGKDPSLMPVVLAATCLQPAVVEELFFRYIALDALRGAMGWHAAVFISSLMFALAHIGTPLSLPILFLLGLLLGYARLGSAGLMLPMLLHFVHNAAILFIELR